MTASSELHPNGHKLPVFLGRLLVTFFWVFRVNEVIPIKYSNTDQFSKVKTIIKIIFNHLMYSHFYPIEWQNVSNEILKRLLISQFRNVEFEIYREKYFLCLAHNHILTHEGEANEMRRKERYSPGQKVSPFLDQISTLSDSHSSFE